MSYEGVHHIVHFYFFYGSQNAIDQKLVRVVAPLKIYSRFEENAILLKSVVTINGNWIHFHDSEIKQKSLGNREKS